MSISLFEQTKGVQDCVIKASLDLQEDYFGMGTQIPYVFIKGKQPGKKGVILSGIHGDELNGIQIIHRLIELLPPENLAGELLLIPIVNVPGFNLHSRYLPDRRDLNRLFPGQPDGSEGSRLAWSIWTNFIQGADFGIDFHSASYNRWNFPHVRGNMRLEKVRKIASSFGATISIHSKGVKGSLRREATMRGIPIILFEAGQANRFESGITESGVRGVFGILSYFQMLTDRFLSESIPEPAVFYYSKSQWIRSCCGGLFIPQIFPGDLVQPGNVLGDIHSIHGDIRDPVRSEINGRVIGLNLHPQVVPGRALYNIAYLPRSFSENVKKNELENGMAAN